MENKVTLMLMLIFIVLAVVASGLSVRNYVLADTYLQQVQRYDQALRQLDE